MFHPVFQTWRVIWACAKKDIKSALTERAFTVVSIFLPLNALILMSLFAVSGGLAPTAVVMEEQGPYAQRFYASMSQAHSFILRQSTAAEAQRLIMAGRIVAVVTIPADFDERVGQNQPVRIDVQINNLNTDFTNDIRRAVPLSITSFYAKAFPNLVAVRTREQDVHAQDTDYIPYLVVSILVLALMISGMMQAGLGAAREWERETMKELLLAPVSQGAILFGKMLGALLLSLVSTALALAAMVLVIHIQPAHWDEVIGFTLLTLVLFAALGTALGTLLRQRQPVTALAAGLSFALFLPSGVFGPLALNTEATQVLAKALPVYYAIVLQQHAFHDFTLNTYGIGVNALILAAFAVGLLTAATIISHRSMAAR